MSWIKILKLLTPAVGEVLVNEQNIGLSTEEKKLVNVKIKK